MHTPIAIPDPNFKWSVERPDIGSVGENGRFLSRLPEGQTDILVEDQRMKNNTAEGSINVVYPYRIEVKVKDVTSKENLNRLHKDDDVSQM